MSVPFSVTDFNLLSCELDRFTFKMLSHFMLKQNEVTTLLI